MTTASHRAARGFAPVERAIAEGHIPGAVLGVLDLDSGARAMRHGGWAQITPQTRPMQADTVFDLASLTKPLFTAARILQAVEAGGVGLDDVLASVIPDLRQYDVTGALERMLTFRQCLAHQTHLPAVWPIYTYGDDPARLRAFVLQRAWPAGPSVYSDINYILLGIALERLHAAKLGSLDPGFGLTFHPDPENCAATEHCQWRERVMCGQVHDENAYALGGVAGHAGLFGSAGAVLDFAAGLMSGEVLGDAMHTEMFRRHGSTRTLGWEAMTPRWSGGGTCSPASIGHTGFTGTGLWIDPQARIAWTWLTNRVHPTRHAESGIIALRRAVGEAVG